MTSDKVPSEITYEDDDAGPVCRWGFQIPDSMPRIQWIKLGLAPDEKLGINSRLSLSYKDSRRAPPPYHASEEDVVTDYLRSLRDHMVKVLESKIGRAFKRMALDFVITVPAMWPESAKAATFACAEEAGLGKASQLRIISEPEAAAIHALQESNPHGLEVGDTIVLCDAGGGTVDLITFSILELMPSLRLKEEAPGTGALCGSTFLNRRFEELLEKRLSSCPGWESDTREEALQRFETVAKRTFSGNVDDDFYFPVPGIADNKAAGVRRGRLRVTGQEMKDIFHPVLQNVHELVQNQVETSSKRVKGIFLVGGFGQSPYLRKYLHNYFSPDIEVLAPVNGWTAVVRGALMKILGEVCPSAAQASVESRIARKHYGIYIGMRFIEGIHDKTRT